MDSIIYLNVVDVDSCFFISAYIMKLKCDCIWLAASLFLGQGEITVLVKELLKNAWFHKGTIVLQLYLKFRKTSICNTIHALFSRHGILWDNSIFLEEKSEKSWILFPELSCLLYIHFHGFD